MSFYFCVDYFGMKYFKQQDAQKFLNHSGTKYKYTVDLSRQNFRGRTFDWDYNKEYVDISMPNYVTDVLSRLQHNK